MIVVRCIRCRVVVVRGTGSRERSRVGGLGCRLIRGRALESIERGTGFDIDGRGCLFILDGRSQRLIATSARAPRCDRTSAGVDAEQGHSELCRSFPRSPPARRHLLTPPAWVRGTEGAATLSWFPGQPSGGHLGHHRKACDGDRPCAATLLLPNATPLRVCPRQTPRPGAPHKLFSRLARPWQKLQLCG